MTDPSVIVSSLRKAFNSGITRDVQWRLNQLQKLLDLIDDNTEELKKAVATDLRKASFEAELMEIMVLKNEIYSAQKNLYYWMKPQYPTTSITQKLDTITLQPEPYGVTLVIGAWNYPINLLLCPFVGAIAAGNCCVLKPSEISVATAALVQKLIPQYLDQDCFQVFCGGVPETTALLEQKFDYIFFTGSTNVGKIVMEAASEHLTPVTLELGGKSPCYIDEGSDLNLVAKRVMWGKLTNIGQTCIAPDYLLCHKSIQNKFLSEFKNVLAQFYGENPQQSEDLGRIVSMQNFNRLKAIMDKMPKEKLEFGGKTDANDKYIELTCYTNVTMDDSVMEQELFGPILPVITVNSTQEAISIINSRDKPLAIYVFSNSNKVIDSFINSTSSGGILINDTLMHCSACNVPFGGVGASGMGSYHGKSSFDTFSHMKPVWKRKQTVLPLGDTRYPPYTDQKLNKMTSMTGQQGFCNIL